MVRVLLPFMSRGELPSDELVAALPSQSLRAEFNLLHEKPSTATGSGGAILDAFKLAANGEKDAVRARLERPAGTLRQRVQSEPTNAYAWSQLGVMEALSGNREEALRCVGQMLALNADAKDLWGGPNYRIGVAHVYAWTGDAESALREYERLLQTMANHLYGVGWVINVHVMRRHPAFAPLRDDPRFKALLDDPKNNAPLF